MVNLQKELDDIILKTQDDKKRLLLHSCCAPCSSYVLEYLSKYFDITLLFYNPNILPEDEYTIRLAEQRRLIDEMIPNIKIEIIVPDYDSETFLHATKGLEYEPEGGKRCDICFRLRLEQAAKVAKNIGADYFTTTLSISPHKDSKKLDEIATELEKIYEVKKLPSDFKKKNGYRRSVELSNEYNLYRQDWCGCPFSKRDRLKQKETEA